MNLLRHVGRHAEAVSHDGRVVAVPLERTRRWGCRGDKQAIRQAEVTAWRNERIGQSTEVQPRPREEGASEQRREQRSDGERLARGRRRLLGVGLSGVGAGEEGAVVGGRVGAGALAVPGEHARLAVGRQAAYQLLHKRRRTEERER